ncbi:cryptochrome/photolyase family protein [Nesterenkonia xinjiangensis]|uniref:Deoxyribodipyrimidine photo-lyase n=1 Tax=Nesterenkonia xinjiangensis TaxID=225327 RepID=A0A7Z0K9R3_9MICC|nr:deoxyribodipyrimidine photo-lyase [Nesterenkonia xinjiangensis]NYJ79024.1 deoxyribodipyrimidine photo-lyase [Nesterenkonia xinjiangensis]
MDRTLCLFRDDLRVTDNPALTAGLERLGSGGDVVALYVLEDSTPGLRPLGGAARWWLHGALEDLRRSLEQLGIPLLLRRGDSRRIVAETAEAARASRVHLTRRYGVAGQDVDSELMATLRRRGVAVEEWPGHLLHEPEDVATVSGEHYKVFTPFWRALRSRAVQEPLPAPRGGQGLQSVRHSLNGLGVSSGDLSRWELRPSSPDWAAGLREIWEPTERAALRHLEDFVDGGIERYASERDLPAAPATSGLSPFLRFGQISVRQVWHSGVRAGGTDREDFLSELAWREFHWHLLHHHPRMAEQNMRPTFDAYPWQSRRDAPELFRAWAQGRTGFPLVDAGQRELWRTGHMHNRVRMVSASLLVKNFGIDWREGEAWFWDTLVDADAASNPGNWQWVAGCGVDAAPYFRIFNPERQRQRFDPEGRYVARWVPELGSTEYPAPVVELQESRQEALAHYQSLG